MADRGMVMCVRSVSKLRSWAWMVYGGEVGEEGACSDVLEGAACV
jgi:hypothetical protein